MANPPSSAATTGARIRPPRLYLGCFALAWLAHWVWPLAWGNFTDQLGLLGLVLIAGGGLLEAVHDL